MLAQPGDEGDGGLRGEVKYITSCCRRVTQREGKSDGGDDNNNNFGHNINDNSSNNNINKA